MPVITISAVPASGKTTLAKMLGDILGTKVYYEPVSKKENPILDKYYKDQSKYGFLQQIFFLNKRFGAIKKAYKSRNAIIDSAIYTDYIFLYKLFKDGKVSEDELNTYRDLFYEMMEEIDGLPYKKTPDLMISIDIGLDTQLERMRKRGRSFEQDDSLKPYWAEILEDYKEWFSTYDLSAKLKIDGEKYDFVNNLSHRKQVLFDIIRSLKNNHKLTDKEYNIAWNKISNIKLDT